MNCQYKFFVVTIESSVSKSQSHADIYLLVGYNIGTHLENEYVDNTTTQNIFSQTHMYIENDTCLGLWMSYRLSETILS